MNKNKVLRTYFIVAGLEGILLAAAVCYRSYAGWSGNGIDLGSPVFDTLSFLIAMLLGGGFLTLAIWMVRKESGIDRLVHRATRNPFFQIAAAACWIGLILASQNIIYLFSRFATPIHFVNYLSVLKWALPFLIWGAVFCGQTLAVLYWIQPQNSTEGGKTPRKALLIPLILSAAVLLLVFGFAGRGLLGSQAGGLVNNQIERFIPLSRPLPGLHLGLIWLFSLIVLWVIHNWRKRSSWFTKNKSALPPVLIWLVAMISWMSAPIDANYAVSITEKPVEAIYPASDSFYFDKEAQRFNLGLGFDDTSTHVMYSTFLSGVHAVVGDDYQDVITLQFGFLALVPVLIFLIARRLDTGFSGLLAALFYIIRERNGMLLSGEVGGPVLNQLISENLALLGMVLFFYLILLWVEEPAGGRWYPLLAGGVMGISLLIRAEFLAVTLAVLGMLLLLFRKNRTAWAGGASAILIVIAIICVPWMYRNWQRTGIFSLDKGDFISRRLGNVLGREAQIELGLPSADALDDFSRKTPGSSFFSHAGNNLHQLVSYLPTNYQPMFVTAKVSLDDLLEKRAVNLNTLTEKYLYLYARSSPYYWYDWDGSVSLRSLIPGFLVLSCLFLGAGRLLAKHRRIWWIFVAILGAQVAIWSFAGYSGSRYMKPVDWISLVVIAIGITRVSSVYLERRAPNLAQALKIGQGKDGHAEPRRRLTGRTASILLAFLILIGLSPSILGALIPPEYSEADLNMILTDNAELIEVTSMQEDSILYGKALYPQFFQGGEMLPDHRQGTLPDPYGPRVDFYLVGTDSIWISLPVENPDQVPVIAQGAEVIVVGQQLDTTYLSEEQKGVKHYIDVDPSYILAERVISPGGNQDWSVSEVILCGGEYCRLR